MNYQKNKLKIKIKSEIKRLIVLTGLIHEFYNFDKLHDDKEFTQFNMFLSFSFSFSVPC